MDDNRSRQSASGHPIAILALWVLAASQLVFATHHFAHDDGLTESCGVCLQLDQFDSSVTPAAAEPALALATDDEAPRTTPSVAAAGGDLAYASRAPPTV